MLPCNYPAAAHAEWTSVTNAVHSIAQCLRPGVTAGDFVADLMKHAVWVRNWWADRNAKAAAGELPLPVPQTLLHRSIRPLGAGHCSMT